MTPTAETKLEPSGGVDRPLPVVVVPEQGVGGALAVLDAGGELDEAPRLPARAEAEDAGGLVARALAGRRGRLRVLAPLVDHAAGEHQLDCRRPAQAERGAGDQYVARRHVDDRLGRAVNLEGEDRLVARQVLQAAAVGGAGEVAPAEVGVLAIGAAQAPGEAQRDAGGVGERPG